MEATEARRLRELEEENSLGSRRCSLSRCFTTRRCGTCSQKMVRPALRRQAVCHMQATFGLSERSACRALGMARASHRYEAKRNVPVELVERMRSLAGIRPRSDYRTLARLREGV